jgi:hypothetical protein
MSLGETKMPTITYELKFNPELQGALEDEPEAFGFEDEDGMTITLDKTDFVFLSSPELLYVEITGDKK